MTAPDPNPVGPTGPSSDAASGKSRPIADASPSVLARLAAAGRFAPVGVHLREAPSDHAGAPRAETPPATNETAGATVGRYRLAAELGRGGVGIVIKGHDLDLGRDVAMKVLLEEHAGTPEVLQRFVEEAQIGGQLQHPGIVPVYELGMRTDKRPYFTMKLIKGRTLAVLLAERKGPSDDLRRLLSIFESICQTMAYAHSRGVIHRDLKPANVMVGAFGEVLVLDWGMGKVLTKGAAVKEREERKRVQPDVSFITTPRSDGSGSRSQSGTVMGTLRYMPPEQAAGDVERVDERSDVFSLGALLCEILTGEPPYKGDGMKLLMAAAGGALTDAFARIDGCGADPELKSLAKVCLSAEIEARPRDAGGVTRAIGAYLASLEEKRKSAEAAADRARVVAAEERKRRRLSMALSAAVLGLVLLGGGGWIWWEAAQRARTREVDGQISKALDETALVQGKAVAAATNLALWDESVVLAGNAGTLARSSDASPEARGRVAKTVSDLTTARAAASAIVAKEAIERRAIERLEDIRMARREIFDTKGMDRGYTEIYRDAGIDVDGPEDVAVLAARIRAFEPERRDLMIGQLYDWQVGRRTLKRSDARLAALLEAVDPDPWMARVRAAKSSDDLRVLAAQADVDRQRVISLLVLCYRLGVGVDGRGDPESALILAKRMLVRHPDEFFLNVYAALFGLDCDPPHVNDALRFASVVVALRPNSAYAHFVQGRALLARGDAAGAVAAYRASISASGDFAVAHSDLGTALRSLGKAQDALAEIREAIRLDPTNSSFHSNLALTYVDFGDVHKAGAALDQALILKPDDASALALKAALLHVLGDPAGALRAAIESLRIDPDSRLDTRVALRVALHSKDRPVGVIAVFQKTVESAPDIPEAHVGLAFALRSAGRFDDSLTEFRKAHELGTPRAGWTYPSARWLADAERIAALAPRATALITGTAQPATGQEMIDAAVIARSRAMYAASARLYADAFRVDAALVHDGATNHRYDAACVAALAGAGAGVESDAGQLGDEARVGWRRQAIDWLASELEVWTERADRGGPGVLRAMREELEVWRIDPDMASIRDPKSLAKLTRDEQRACRSVIRDVGLLMDRAREAK